MKDLPTTPTSGSSFSTDRFKAVPLLQFFVNASVVSFMISFCHYLFPINPSIGAPGRLSFVIPGYPSLIFLLCEYVHCFQWSFRLDSIINIGRSISSPRLTGYQCYQKKEYRI